MDPAVPLVVCAGQPRRPRVARGHHRQPELLDDAARAAADGAARRGRHRAGRRRHLPVASAGPATRRSSSSRTRSRPTPRAGPRSPASTRTRSRSTPCPHIDVFLDNGYTKEEWKVVTESRKILHLPDLRLSCTAVRVPVFVSHSEAVHVETRDPITPAEARALFAGVTGRRGPGRSRQQRLPAGDRGRRHRRGLRRPRPPGPVDPGQPRARVLGRVGQPAQGRGVERRRAGRAARGARLDPQGQRAAGRWGRQRVPRRDPRRAPRGARRDRERGPGLHALPARTRAGRRPCPARATPTPRSCSSARARASTRTARGGRSSGRAGGLLVRLLGRDRLAARGRVHHQRREVPPARQPRPAGGRDRRLRAVPPAPARGARPGGRRDARPVLDGDVHARRADRPGPRHEHARPIPRPAPATRSCSRCTTRRPRCARRRSSARASRTSPGSRPCCSGPASAAPAPPTPSRHASRPPAAADAPPSPSPRPQPTPASPRLQPPDADPRPTTPTSSPCSTA